MNEDLQQRIEDYQTQYQDGLITKKERDRLIASTQRQIEEPKAILPHRE